MKKNINETHGMLVFGYILNTDFLQGNNTYRLINNDCKAEFQYYSSVAAMDDGTCGLWYHELFHAQLAQCRNVVGESRGEERGPHCNAEATDLGSEIVPLEIGLR